MVITVVASQHTAHATCLAYRAEAAVCGVSLIPKWVGIQQGGHAQSSPAGQGSSCGCEEGAGHGAGWSTCSGGQQQFVVYCEESHALSISFSGVLACLPAGLSVCLPACLSVCLSCCLSVCLSCLSACLCVLSVCRSVCLSACLPSAGLAPVIGHCLAVHTHNQHAHSKAQVTQKPHRHVVNLHGH